MGPLTDFRSVEALRAVGFEGFVPLISFDTPAVQAAPGLYVVLRTSGQTPEFLECSAGGHFKGKDPSVPRARLEARWLAETPVIYIDKAGGSTSSANLATRLLQYKSFCLGEPVGHWGGRFICQLADLADLLVAWRGSSGSEATEDAAAIVEFKSQYGQYPFANLRR